MMHHMTFEDSRSRTRYIHEREPYVGGREKKRAHWRRTKSNNSKSPDLRLVANRAAAKVAAKSRRRNRQK